MDIAEVEVFTKMLKSSNIKETDALEIEIIMNKMKRVKIDEVHKNKITPPKDSKGKWMTWVKREGEERRKVTAKTEEKLYEKMYEYYFVMVIPTIKVLFPKWLEKKEEEGLSPRSIKRYEQHWVKYFKNTDLVQLKVDEITPDMLERLFHGLIRRYGMTRNEFSNVRPLIREPLKMAFRSGFITINPFKLVDIKTYQCMPKPNPDKTERIYLADEKVKLFKQIRLEREEFPHSTHPLAIALLFKLGVRLGELVVLKFSDVNFRAKRIHIHRMESKDYDENGNEYITVVEHVKKKSRYGDRYLNLEDYTLDLIHLIKQVNHKYGYELDDFMFVRQDGRITLRDVDRRIRKLCKKAGIPVKSAHDIRRTVASEMFANTKEKFSLEEIKEYLGHSDIKTTSEYIYNPLDDETMRRKLNNAMTDNNRVDLTELDYEDTNTNVIWLESQPNHTQYSNVVQFPVVR